MHEWLANGSWSVPMTVRTLRASVRCTDAGPRLAGPGKQGGMESPAPQLCEPHGASVSHLENGESHTPFLRLREWVLESSKYFEFFIHRLDIKSNHEQAGFSPISKGLFPHLPNEKSISAFS